MRKNKKIKKTYSFNSYIFTIIATICIMILIFNDFGLITYFKYKKQHSLLTQELQQLLAQQDTLRVEIDQLQYSQDYIEKIAREKFMMVKPGEKIYKVEDIKTVRGQ
mgnify:CR=1 FL=1